MINISTSLTQYVAAHLTDKATGVNAVLKIMRSADPATPGEIHLVNTHNAASELLEKANQAAYPDLSIYCEKLFNTLREKFRTFSGSARMVVELRNSHDRVSGLDSTSIYGDIICGVLDSLRGEWMTGVFYAGGYEVAYSAIRAGGKQFLQTVKISFEVSVSK